MRSLVLAALLASCAPGYTLATGKTAPVALLAADMVAFTVAGAYTVNEYNKPEHGDSTRLAVAGAITLAAWLPYWFFTTLGEEP